MAKKKSVVSTKKNVASAKKNVTTTKKNKKNKLSMIILVAAIVLIVAGIGGYLLSNKDSLGGAFNAFTPGSNECYAECKPLRRTLTGKEEAHSWLSSITYLTAAPRW